MNFITVLVALAITAILAAIAVPDIGSIIQSSENASAQRAVYSAWNTATADAIKYSGATLLLSNGNQLRLTAGESSATQETWHLPANTSVLLNGKPFSCLGWNGNAVPSTTTTCQTSITTSTIPAFTISIQGGPNVPAIP